MKHDFIRKQYDHEIDRQDKIVSSLGLSIGILTALGSVSAAMVQGFSYNLPRATVIFNVLAVADVVLFLSALYFLRKAMFGQTYEYLPRLFEIRAYYDGLIAFYVGEGQTESAAVQAADGEFGEYLVGRMIKAGTKNAINNDEKSSARYHANWSVWGALIITGLMVFPYVVDQRSQTRPVPVVHIDNLDPKK